MQNLCLALETSCDDTSVAVLDMGSHRVLAHHVVSQEVHRAYGGVVPEVAARDHLEVLPGLVDSALNVAGAGMLDLSCVAVTLGPGLIGALMVGVLYARGLALGSSLPLRGVNHVDAHLSPALLLGSPPEFPALALTVSGGHCLLSLLPSPSGQRTVLGRTADDACGEAFDKTAKLLGLPYPGGPEVERLASKCLGTSLRFPSVLRDPANRLGMSFSGLKTAVLLESRKEPLTPQRQAEIAYAFQEAAFGQLANRLGNALADHPQVRSVLVAGGVAANGRLRGLLSSTAGVPVHYAPLAYCSDNAVMIGLQAGLHSTCGFQTHPFPSYDTWSQCADPGTRP